MAGSSQRARQGQGSCHVGAGVGVPVVLSGVAIVAGKAHFVCSWVPLDRHPVGEAEGCGPQVRELGLHGAGNHVLHSRGSPTWQWQKGLAFGVKAFAASPLCGKLRAA